MTWVKLDDAFPDHPKIHTVGRAGGWAQVRAFCYAARYMTDGFLPAPVAERFAKEEGVRVAAMVDADLWHTPKSPCACIPPIRRDGTWYYVHDYLVYNFSKAQIAAEMEARKDRARAGARARWGPSRNAPGILEASPTAPLEESSKDARPHRYADAPSSSSSSSSSSSPSSSRPELRARAAEIIETWNRNRGGMAAAEENGSQSPQAERRLAAFLTARPHFDLEEFRITIQALGRDPWACGRTERRAGRYTLGELIRSDAYEKQRERFSISRPTSTQEEPPSAEILKLREFHGIRPKLSKDEIHRRITEWRREHEGRTD